MKLINKILGALAYASGFLIVSIIGICIVIYEYTFRLFSDYIHPTLPYKGWMLFSAGIGLFIVMFFKDLIFGED